MNIQTMKTVWRRLRRPSQKTLDQIQAAGAAVDRNYWPDYTPRRPCSRPAQSWRGPCSPESRQWERITRTLTARIGQ